MLERLKAVAAQEGLPWGLRTMTCNSRRAQELGKWAQERGKGEAWHRAMFSAYFAEGKNLYDLGVLSESAALLGLDPARPGRWWSRAATPQRWTRIGPTAGNGGQRGAQLPGRPPPAGGAPSL